MMEFMQQETIMTSEAYCETLKNCVRTVNQNKRRGMLISSVPAVLLHDNESSHAAACTRALLELSNWELFDHSPYSPDLAPSDYHSFTYLKNWFQLQLFNNNEDLMKGSKRG
jgi:histone-lysine N-methyltransferase SETMAR